jgi:spoIIIJ-associated protein
MESSLDKIKSIIEDFLRVMDFSGNVTVDSEGDNFFRVGIESADAAFLIGRSGETLGAIQQLCRAIISKKMNQPFQMIVDVNDYQRNRLESLKEMALNLAREVVQLNEPRWLSPMNAYERRLIHLTLAEYPGVKTESEGQGDERRIVIRPR